MNTKNSSINDSSEGSTEVEEISIITLISCDYDSSVEENDYADSSQDSIDSSELVDDSDDEAQYITEIYQLNKKLDKTDEKINEKNSEAINVSI